MNNKVTVSIAGHEYTMVATEDDAYVRKCASYVDAQVREVLGSSQLSLSDAATLAAMNISDQYFKEQASCENLRRQITEEIEASNKIKMELSEAKREIFKLQNKR